MLKRATCLGSRVLLTLNRPPVLTSKSPLCSLVSFQNNSTRSSVRDQLLEFGKPLSSLDNLVYAGRANLWTSSFPLNAAQKEPTKGGSLSDELQNIMSKKFAEEKEQSTKDAQNLKPKEEAAPASGAPEKTPTGWAKYFTREHGWKISFLFFTGMIGSLAIYILIEWGAPRRDENNQIVC